MTPTPTPENLELQLEEVFKTTAQVSAIVHWLTLPDRTRGILSAALAVYSNSELALRIGKDEALVGKWREQAAQLTLVFDLIRVRLFSDGTYLTNRSRGFSSRSGCA